MNPAMHDERRQELLVDRALHGLTDGEERELCELLPRDHDVEVGSYERAAAALHLAFLSRTLEPLPTGLRDRLTLDAGAELAGESDPEQADN